MANAAISLLSGAQDPSQLQAQLNALILTMNGYLNGTTPTTVGLVTGTTSANLPAFGAVILSSTVAGAAYKLSAPVPNQQVELITKNTKSQTVTLVSGNFVDSRTKITFKTTNVGLPQAMTLVGLSTSVWGIQSVSGVPKCT